VIPSDDHTARVWNAASGEVIAKLQGHSASVTSAAFSPDGQRVVTASRDGTARVWNAASGEVIFMLEGHSGHVLSAALSPDGQRVVTASDDGTARVWNAASGEVIAELEDHSGPVYRVEFSPDGRRGVNGQRRPYRTYLQDCHPRRHRPPARVEIGVLSPHTPSGPAISCDNRLVCGTSILSSREVLEEAGPRRPCADERQPRSWIGVGNSPSHHLSRIRNEKRASMPESRQNEEGKAL